MDRNKNQGINFSYEVIPVMFHSQTTDFLTFIERDGLKFLEFWWNYIGDQLPDDMLCSFTGMDFSLIKMDEDQQVVMITLPLPNADGEIYYLALYAKPERRFGWVKLPNTRVIAMVKKSTPDFPQGTEIGDITPRGRYVPIHAGPPPTFENMTAVVNKLLQPSKA